MIWPILGFLGVPLWLCAVGILLVLRSRRLHGRHGNIPVRVLRPGHRRWTRGNAIWLSDVFAWRGSPAAWAEDLFQVVEAHDRDAGPAEVKALHHLGAECAVVELSGSHGATPTVAAAGAHRQSLLGPFTPTAAPAAESPPSGVTTEGGSTS